MRPIKLSMTAFGPFVNTEAIDFEQLGDKPLFLINGPTGSGKTTILDAICFALYGQTTGKEREAGQMRCDYADDKTLTQVEFTFELGGKQYRILRIPEQQRAKSKGEGTTRQAATAELWQIDGDSENLLVARKVSDATKMIEELTGLQVDQFRQVMVLPQGQFRRLLMADSKDRELIFSQLFETHIYKRIEDKLKALAKDVYIKVARLKENQQGILQSVEFESVDELEGAIQTLTPESKAAKADVKLKEKAYLQAVKAKELATALAADFQNLKLQEEKLKRLQQQTSEFKDKRIEVEHAELAQKIAPVFSDLSRSSQTLKTISTQLHIAEQVFTKSKESLRSAEKELANNESLSQQLDQLKHALTRLQGYRERSSKLQQAHNKLNKAKEECQLSNKKLEGAKKVELASQKELEENEKQKQELEKALAKNAEVSILQQKLSNELAQKQQIEELFKQKSQLEKQLEIVTNKGKVLADGLIKKQNQAKQIELLWHNGQAAILARELKEDQACPVCGSLEHPKPAHAVEQLPTDQERENAQQMIVTAQEEVQKARDSYTQLNAQLKGTTEQITAQQKLLGTASNTTFEDLQQQFKTVSAQAKQHQIQQQQLQKLGMRITELKQKGKTAREHLEKLAKANTDLNAEMHRSLALVEEANKELPEEYRQAGKLESDICNTEKTIKQLDLAIKLAQQQHIDASKKYTEANTQLENQKKLQQNAQDEFKRASSEWESALKQSTFEDDTEYQNAHIEELSLKTLKASITDYDKQYQQAKGALKQQQEALKDKQVPELAALQLQLEYSLQEKKQAEETLNQLDSKLVHLGKALTTLNKISKDQQKEEEEYKVVGTLSNVANGQTGNKISLQRFVLSVLLDDVLIEASHRLKMMSKGRYLLLRKEDRAKGNKASGLELEVEDNYTGKVRAVSTLSGGESFMASLSLALGLSDVVQAYAGGIRLDTLFIDEGFGSLDADSLDLAIRTLIDLRDTGRMVGIISHVSELKEQISLRLDVISDRNGSSIRLVH